ncbi:hypothetical protein, partial [Cupriavidus sp.]|uniref:hypothetical protein n=1 Tax=Cupriavidus sp. TaxID=1873897 RepID=UPI0025BC13A2
LTICSGRSRLSREVLTNCIEFILRRLSSATAESGETPISNFHFGIKELMPDCTKDKPLR